MKRTLVYVILTILVAGWLGNLIVKDPGYVLLSFDGSTLQTSLWVFLGTLVIIALVVYGLLKIFRLLISSGWALNSWRARQRATRANANTQRGTIALIEGHWLRAQNYLLKGAADSGLPLVNYVGAARAAQQQGDSQKRDEYLQQAQQNAAGSELAIGITKATLQLDNEQWREAVASLSGLTHNALVLELLLKAYTNLQDWLSCKALLPELRKNLDKERYAVLEAQIWCSVLETAGSGNDTPDGDKQQGHYAKLWKEVPSELKKNSELLVRYVKFLLRSDEKAEARTVIVKALKTQWNESLVESFGKLITTDPEAQLKIAKSWLEKHPDNASILLCIGRLYVQLSDFESASFHLEKSMAVARNRETCLELGKVVAKLGDLERSNQLYLMALAD